MRPSLFLSLHLQARRNRQAKERKRKRSPVPRTVTRRRRVGYVKDSILKRLKSLPKKYRQVEAEIVSSGKCGAHTVRRAWKELLEEGKIYRARAVSGVLKYFRWDYDGPALLEKKIERSSNCIQEGRDNL